VESGMARLMTGRRGEWGSVEMVIRCAMELSFRRRQLLWIGVSVLKEYMATILYPCD
jgi:hypothetical protein